MKPGTLATRAINQYRTRDVIPYLALRYYLENSCARSDRWASEVAVHLTQTRNLPTYFEAQHFKETQDNGQVLHRSILLPGPNEALSEAVLLAECSKHDVFESLPCVYSYRLAKQGDKSGIFEPYFSGFRQRHQDVANACREYSDGTVLYTDIKKFYPNIRARQASEAWAKSCRDTAIPKHLSALGHKLLEDHSLTCQKHNQGHGLLTGPMFSHLIANQLLRPVDEAMSRAFPGKYFRYVDDVIIVGSTEEIHSGQKQLTDLLEGLHLELHGEEGGKTFSVEGAGWLKGADDFDDEHGRYWMMFVGDLRRFLIAKPLERAALAAAFAAEGFNIPLPNYLAAASESGPMQRLSDFLSKYRWAGKSLQRISPSLLLGFAKGMRIVFADRLARLLEVSPDVRGYERKRLIPKLRYFGGRLLYLGTSEMQIEFSKGLHRYPELQLLAAVLESVATRDVTKLLPLGSNAVQSAAQVLRLSAAPVRYSLKALGEAELQGVATLQMNGVKLAQDSLPSPNGNELNRFATSDAPMLDLIREASPFVQEMACLHGADGSVRHSNTLDTAFDRDEQLAFDVLNQLSQSGYA